MNAGELQQYLRAAGWPENLIVTMAAIGLAESSGRPCAVGTLANNEYSVGLWQININPALRRPWTKEQLCDPLFNAKVALQIYGGYGGGRKGLTNWGAYTDGRYRRYLPESQAAYSPHATPTLPTISNADYQDTPVSEPVSSTTKLLISAGALLGLYLLIK